MHSKLQILIVVSHALFSITFATADVSPFSPPFLRTPGEKPSQPTFNYLQYQPPPAPLIPDNPAYNVNPHQHLNPQPDNLNVGAGILRSGHEEMNHNPHLGDFNIAPGAYPSEYIPASGGPSPMQYHNPQQQGLQSHNPQQQAPQSAMGNMNAPSPANIKVGRPQLRQLDLDSVSGRSANAGDNKSVASARTRTPNRRGRSNNRVSEGHRLITRALWRIFDALMERNEKEELHGRMAFVEGAIKDMITSDSKLEGLMEMIKEENMGQEHRLEELSQRLEETRRLSSRLEQLENWRLSFERQHDAGMQHHENASPISHSQPAYTSCPSPFETVEGECFYVAGETKRSWQDARRDCSKYGGDLAAPQNLDSLRTYLQSLAYQPEYVWVGASRQGNGDWVWSVGAKEGQQVDMSRDTWNEDLPNGLGNCMGLYEGAAYRAYDYHCSEEDLYVCQFFL